jgi:hypothetical protein
MPETPKLGNEPKKETVGAASLRLQSQGDQKQGVVDTQKEMLKGYMDNLIECAMNAKNVHPDVNPLYICVQTRRERTMVNVLRNLFYYRQTRPRPEYDMALYTFDPTTEELKFEWQIPDKETCNEMAAHPLDVPPEESTLLNMVLAFKSGNLV